MCKQIVCFPPLHITHLVHRCFFNELGNSQLYPRVCFFSFFHYFCFLTLSCVISISFPLVFLSQSVINMQVLPYAFLSHVSGLSWSTWSSWSSWTQRGERRSGRATIQLKGKVYHVYCWLQSCLCVFLVTVLTSKFLWHKKCFSQLIIIISFSMIAIFWDCDAE